MERDERYDDYGVTINYNPSIVINNVVGGNASSSEKTDNHRRSEGIDSSGLNGLVSGIGGLMRLLGSM